MESENSSINDEPRLRQFLASFVLVPGAIVLVCLAIAMGIRWLTSTEPSAEQLVDTIEGNEGNVRWRAAMQLAGMLADAQHSAIRTDEPLAQRLAATLRRELASGGSRREDVLLRVFLCRALGEFECDSSLPVLVDAADSQRGADVRRSALEAIALLAGSLGSERVREEPRLEDSLMTASGDDDPQVRLTVAYALGVLGGTEAEARLVAMLADENELVRYNAATGLARQGNASAVDVLLEMLRPEQNGVFRDETSAPSRSSEAELVHVNALRAISRLLEANPEIAKERLREAIAHLDKMTDSPAVRAEIRKLSDADGF